MDLIANINGIVNDFVWGVPAIAMILVTGVFVTIKFDFVQFKNFGYLLEQLRTQGYTQIWQVNERGEVRITD